MFQNILKRIKKMTERRAVVLMYHQVCDRRADPWELAVHPNHFDAQLRWLKQNFDVVPMSEIPKGISHRRMRNTVAITFDDGFKDNYTNAAPLLDWHGMPATFYLATSALRQGYVYWWDALQEVILHSPLLPARFDMIIGETPVRFSFNSDRILNDHVANQIRAWNYNLPIPNERISLYMQLWHHVKSLEYTHQRKVIDAIREWAGHTQAADERSATMSIREMQMLGENPLFSIGAHSVHHCMLSHQRPIDQAFEVKESKKQIEAWLGRPVEGFAYPYGNYNEVTQALLKDAGFLYAVSTEAKAIAPDDDPFALPRIQVGNWCVYEFAMKLNELVNE